MGVPAKGRADYLELGDWNALCGECGRKRKASTMLKLPPGVPGSGLYVCPEHWTPRQPQDFVKGVPDLQTVPWAQPPTSFTPQDYFEATQSGTADALVLTVSGETIIGPYPGQIFRFTANATNTTAATARLSISTVSYEILDADGADLVAGSITSGTAYFLTFDGLGPNWTLNLAT